MLLTAGNRCNRTAVDISVPRREHPYRDNALIAENLNPEKGVTSVGQHIFLHPTSLEEIVLPRTLTEIGCGAFAGRNHVKRTMIPNTAGGFPGMPSL